MPSRTPREAAAAFVLPYQEIVRCLTDDGLVSRRSRAQEVRTAVFQRSIVSLRRRAGLSPMRIRIVVDYTVQNVPVRPGLWEARTAGWAYDVLDSGGRPILAFHWHPQDSGRVTWPHLHAYGSHDSVELHKLHPPTGQVTLGSLVRFLIEDLDVLPRRPDWQTVLDRHAVV